MSDSEKELFGEEEDERDVSADEHSEIAHEPVHHSVFLKRYAPSHNASHAWISRIPAFLNLEPRPFDASKFAETEKSDDQLALEANTVRWKYAAAAESDAEQKVTRVSNARIVEWSDGSRTLQLGSEHFEIKTHSQSDPAFFCTEHEEQSILATRRLVSDTMSFLPTSTSSATHIMLARALQRKQESGQIRVGSVNTTEDPDKMQREIEKAEQAKEKARRKLAAQRDEIVSYTDRSISRPSSVGIDEEDEEDDREEEDEEGRDEDEESEAEESDADNGSDDMIDDNEEEPNDEERAERLNRIKRQNGNDDEEETEVRASRPKVLDDEDSE